MQCRKNARCPISTPSAFAGYILSHPEVGVRGYHDRLGQVIPAFTLQDQPSPGSLAEVNGALVASRDKPVW